MSSESKSRPGEAALVEKETKSFFKTPLNPKLKKVLSKRSEIAWRKGLPKQKYVAFEVEKIDPVTKEKYLLIELVASFNKGDGIPRRDKDGGQFEENGKPFFIVSPKPMGAIGVGAAHFFASMLLGLYGKCKYGFAVYKGLDDYQILIPNRSAEENASDEKKKRSIEYDEEYELAHEFFENGNEDYEHSLKYMIRRSLPVSIIRPIGEFIVNQLHPGERDRVILEEDFGNEVYEIAWEKADRDEKNRMLMKTVVLAAEVGKLALVEKVLTLAKQRNLNLPLDLNYEARENNTALMLAAKNGHLSTIEILLKNGASLHAKNPKEETALMLAAKNGRAQAIKILLAAGADINAKNNEGDNALILAAKNGHVNVVEILLAATDKQKSNETSVFLLAAEQGNFEVIKLLIDFRERNILSPIDLPLINRIGNNGATALSIAAERGHLDIVAILLKARADPNIENLKGETALMSAARNGHVDVIKLLLQHEIPEKDEKKPSVALKQENQLSKAMLLAAEAGHIEAVKTLLQAGVNINSTDASGNSALMLAVKNGHTQLAMMLIGAGALTDINNRVGDSVFSFVDEEHIGEMLLQAIAINHTDTVIGLMARAKQLKFDLSTIKDVSDNSPWHLAIMNANQRVIDELFLAEQPPRLLTHNDQKKLPFDLNNSAAPKELKPALLRGRFRVKVHNQLGNEMLRTASRHPEDIEYLNVIWEYARQNAVDIPLGHVDENGNTPLLVALKAGHLVMARWLLDHGIDPRQKNKSGDDATPFLTRLVMDRLFERNLEAAIKAIATFPEITIEPTVFNDYYLSSLPKEDLEKSLLLLIAHEDIPKTIKDAIKFHACHAALATESYPINITKLLTLFTPDLDFLRASDPEGNTLLHLAALKGEVETVKLLLAQKALNPLAVNKKGLMPFQQAGVSHEIRVLLQGVAEEAKKTAVSARTLSSRGMFAKPDQKGRAELPAENSRQINQEQEKAASEEAVDKEKEPGGDGPGLIG